MLALAQASGNPPLSLLFAILGAAGVGLCALAIGTWSGSARSAYIRRYNKVYGTQHPAGYLEEVIRQGTLDYETRQFDLLNIQKQRRRQEQRAQIWGALDEPQADPELERLRLRAQRRGTVAAFLYGGAMLAGFAVVTFLWSRQ